MPGLHLPVARVLVATLVTALSSCQYSKDRVLDALDPYRVAVGAGTVVGVRSKSLGLYDTGVLVGVKPKISALGWKYGHPLFFDQSDLRYDSDQAEIIKTTSVVDLDIATGSYRSAQNSAALLPALFTWADATPTEVEWAVPAVGEDYDDRIWLWSAESFRRNRYAQVHAFDIETEIAIGVYLDLGFSPGELVDFFLGFLTIDIAEDDGRL